MGRSERPGGLVSERRKYRRFTAQPKTELVLAALAHPLPQRFGMNPQVASDLGDRALGLKDQPNAPIE